MPQVESSELDKVYVASVWDIDYLTSTLASLMFRSAIRALGASDFLMVFCFMALNLLGAIWFRFTFAEHHS